VGSGDPGTLNDPAGVGNSMTTRRDELANVWADGCTKGAHPAFPLPMNRLPELLRLSFAEGYDAGRADGIKEVIEALHLAPEIRRAISEKFGVKK
jgi:hypothetical protein